MKRLFSSKNQPAKKKSVAGKNRITTKQTCHLSKLAFAVKSAKIKGNVSKWNNNDNTYTDDVPDIPHVKIEPMLTLEKKMAMGLLVVTHEELRVAVKVCYITEFNEPDESEWTTIIMELSQCFGLRHTTIRRIFTDCRNGKKMQRSR